MAARQVEATWRALAQIQEVIRFADLKAGAVLAGSAGLSGVTVTAAKDARGPGVWLLAVGAGLLLVAGLMALGTLTPRVARPTGSDRVYQVGMLPRHFHHDRSGYITTWLSLSCDDADLADELADQLWTAQIIATRKFIGVGWAIRALTIAAPVLWLALLIA